MSAVELQSCELCPLLFHAAKPIEGVALWVVHLNSMGLAYAQILLVAACQQNLP